MLRCRVQFVGEAGDHLAIPALEPRTVQSLTEPALVIAKTLEVLGDIDQRRIAAAQPRGGVDRDANDKDKQDGKRFRQGNRWEPRSWAMAPVLARRG